MAISNGSTIAASDLNTSADGKRTVLNTVATTTHGLRVPLVVSNFSSAAAEVTRSVVFTPQDNYELVSLWCMFNTTVDDGAYTVTLSVASGETEFILDDSVTATVTGTTSGTDVGTADFSATTATRYVLRKGVAYKLVLTGSDDADWARGFATFKLKRRPK